MLGEAIAQGVFTTEFALRTITDQEFDEFQQFILRQTGIFLSANKRALLVGRLSRRVRALGLNSFHEYYSRIVEDNDEAELREMVSCICTNETHFFREPKHFDLLAERIFPEWKAASAAGLRNRKIRVWSAACSTGEEPFSLAMLLLQHFPKECGWELEILATDLSPVALKKASTAEWLIEKSEEIPSDYLKAYMLRGVGQQAGKMRAGPEIRSIVQFAPVNLIAENYAISGDFDLVFCRNVLIYFNRETKTRVIHRIIQHLAPQGFLFLGHAESLNGIPNRLHTVQPTVYTWTAQGQPGSLRHPQAG